LQIIKERLILLSLKLLLFEFYLQTSLFYDL
jgi:hypothetical protein